MHVPIEIARAAREQAKALGADCCVAVGGGSTTGLAKAIALVSTLPILAIPTTYAGSEMTPIWGITESGSQEDRPRRARAAEDRALRSHADGQHAGRALGHQRDELDRALRGGSVFEGRQSDHFDDRRRRDSRAGSGVAGGGKGTWRIWTRDRKALYGAWLGGMALGAVGMALHHKLCHTLGGSFNLPHAETHTVMLPHATAYTAPAAARGDVANRTRAGGDIGRARPVRSGGFARRANVACGARAEGRPISIRPRTSRCRIPTTIRAR